MNKFLLAVLYFGVTGIGGGQVITEFAIPCLPPCVPLPGAPGGITAGPDGNLWFAESGAIFILANSLTAIGRITPEGAIAQFPTPSAGSRTGSNGLGSIAIGPDGSLWFTELDNNQIGRITNGAVFSEFPIRATNSGPQGIAAGPDGSLWFTESYANQIGRITTSGVIVEFAIPSGNSHPQSIAAGADGNLWFTEGNANQVGRITAAGVISEFPIPTTNSGPYGIAAGPDGNLWFTESLGNRIGRLTTSGDVSEFLISPGIGSYPQGIAAGPDGNLWFTEGFANRIGRITPSGAISEYPIPTASSDPRGIAAGSDGNIWFTEAGAAKIGRINLSQLPGCVPTATTLCLNGGRFSVTAEFQTTPEGPSAPATAVRLTDDTGYFWFFDPANVEVVVKVLNGCAVDDAYWFFGAGLTNLGVQLQVTDTRTEEVKTYSNAWGKAFQPIQDTSAFACP